MKKQLYTIALSVYNTRKNGSHICLLSTNKWSKDLIELRTADDVHEQMHQLLEAVLAACDRVAMPVAHLAIINDAGIKFINKASEPEKCT